MKNEYHVIGLMSGTSLDGLDIAACKFIEENGSWSFEIIDSITKKYSSQLKIKLFSAHTLNALDLAKLNVELGQKHGELTNEFISHLNISFDFIASHGHTVFHQPEHSLTTQISSATHIAAITGLSVIADFRTTDIALGGQGAPLVPIGDLHLFQKFDMCLNLGGVANISLKQDNSIVAFDICICNMALNYLSEKVGKEYDASGLISASGKLNHSLLEKLNGLDFFRNDTPKSLGKEFFEKEILPIVDISNITIGDIMHTFVEHIAMQIGRATINGKKLLITGGGAYNDFLIERIKFHCKSEVIIPEDNIIQFKEALIFAFLGVLRIRKEVNCLKSVTGAQRNSVGGAIYHA